MSYSVEIRCSHENTGRDDSLAEFQVPTLEAAHAALSRLKSQPRFRTEWQYASIKGPEGNNILEDTTNPNFVEDDDSDERREFVMQHGMAHGVDGYNEAMGFDTDEPDHDSSFRRK